MHPRRNIMKIMRGKPVWRQKLVYSRIRTPASNYLKKRVGTLLEFLTKNFRNSEIIVASNYVFLHYELLVVLEQKTFSKILNNNFECVCEECRIWGACFIKSAFVKRCVKISKMSDNTQSSSFMKPRPWCMLSGPGVPTIFIVHRISMKIGEVTNYCF